MSHSCRTSTALTLLLLLTTSASAQTLPAAALLEGAAVAEVVVEDVGSAPADLPAVDHLVTVERVLQGSVPGTSLIVRVPLGQRPVLRAGERAVLSLTPARDGSFRLLRLMAESPGGTIEAADTPLGSESFDPFAGEGEPESGWSAAEKIVTGIFEGNGFVSTLAALNLEDVAGKATVLLKDADGELVGDPAVLFFGPRALRVQPLSRMFPEVVSHRGPFTVELVSNGILFAASAILLEIESEDQIFIPASPMETDGAASSGEMFFPRVVHGHGPFDTLLTSRLVAFNPAAEGRLLTFELWERGQDNTAPRTAYRYVEPGRSLRVDDVLLDLFGLEDRIGALRVVWSGPAGPAPRIVSLMFSGTDGGQGKRFGALVDTATETGAIHRRGSVAGAGQAATSRSSFGVVNLTSSNTNLRLTLKAAEGHPLAVAQVGLKPRQHLERNLTGLFPGTGNGAGWIVETEVVDGGPVLTYLAQMDASGDIFYNSGHSR
jgi:hypothetical protein